MKLGKAFSDNVILEARTKSKLGRGDEDSWWLGAGRALMIATIFCVAFFVLLWKLFDLTIIQGHHFRTLADGNKTRELTRHAPRGLLLDRAGRPLTQNIPFYRLIKPCADNGTLTCVTPLSREEGDALEEQGLPAGEFLEVDYRRQYADATTLSHILGYTGEVTEKELTDDYYKLRDYSRGDRIGRTGAEAVFEEKLRGRDGRELVEVDSQGKVLRTLGRDHEIAGSDVRLSIDEKLQEVVAASFPPGEKGAVVVSKPTTGEILALYSNPSFDLNAFSFGLSQSAYETLINDPDQPLFNRAIGGTYPPGSTYKLVIGLAALEEGAIAPGTTVEDVGVMKIGPFSFPNWYFVQYGKTEGFVNLVKAIARSNDIFFYKAGEWLGITKLVSWSKKVGIGKPLGIELSGEAGGLMPDPEWKAAKFSSLADLEAQNDEWYLGDTYHVSIGQGYLLVTPLQVNAWTNIVANYGRLCKPTIQKVNGEKEHIAKTCKSLGIKKEAISVMTLGMKQACETGGTGYPLFDFGVRKEIQDTEDASPSSQFIRVPVACKTGTAEFGDPQDKTHAWFTAFAPLPSLAARKAELSQSNGMIAGEPEISVTVLVEGAGEGSSVAAPIAKKILEEWFRR